MDVFHPVEFHFIAKNTEKSFQVNKLFIERSVTTNGDMNYIWKMVKYDKERIHTDKVVLQTVDSVIERICPLITSIVCDNSNYEDIIFHSPGYPSISLMCVSNPIDICNMLIQVLSMWPISTSSTIDMNKTTDSPSRLTPLSIPSTQMVRVPSNLSQVMSVPTTPSASAPIVTEAFSAV